MEKYIRISEKERIMIEEGIMTRKSIRAIGREIGRSAKTVRAEIARNGGREGYYAKEAHNNRTSSNRKGYSKIERDPELKEYIVEHLKIGWSPVVISGRWNKEHRKRKISAETIYQWIYNQKNKDLINMLPQKRKRRGYNKSRKNKTGIDLRVSITQRPEAVETRERLGDFEGDTMFQKGDQSQCITTVVERKSRFVMVRKNSSKHTNVVLMGLKNIKDTSPCEMKSITFDNGKEFANHYELAVSTYFCHPGSPWEKGSVEHMNGILRRHLDYKINLNDVSQENLDQIAHKINNTPRKILKFLTPYEVIQQHIKKEQPCT